MWTKDKLMILTRSVSWLLILSIGLLGCSQMQPHGAQQRERRSGSAAVDLDAVQGLLWAGEEDFALALLETQRWENTGSVAAERRWQDLMRRRGLDRLLPQEMARLRQLFPGLDPDLDYLEARILEDGPTRAKELQVLHRRWPGHVWIRLGNAATGQLLDHWQESAELLQESPASGPSTSFQLALEARQAVHDGQGRAAFALLEPAAFEQGEELALLTYLDLAESVGDGRRLRRAAAELALREAPQAAPLDQVRIDLAMERFFAEAPWMRQASLDEQLARIDQYCRRADAPTGWSQQPRYALAGFATLVQPEPFSGEVAARWLAAGRFLLAGEALGRGSEIHLLTDTVAYRLPWPGEEREITVVLARGLANGRQRLAQGGTVFRGFYLRLDSLQRGIDQLQRRLRGRLQDQATTEAPLPRMDQAPLAENERLADPDDLESAGLADRLRVLALQESSLQIDQLELRHLVTHESGHLGEILPWLNQGLPLLEVVPLFLASQGDYGDPMLWLEYRAELRALAASETPHWFLAEIVERAQDPRDPYHRPYRRLLRQLLSRARALELPPLADWDRLPTATLHQLATAEREAQGLTPIPQAGLELLWERLDQGNLLEQLPGNRPAAIEVDHGQVQTDG